MDGFLLIDKPAGYTSQDVLTILKKKLHLKKCGHSGTLDPNTTGLLVVACDGATKLLPLLNQNQKEYETTILFDYRSDTLDIYGSVEEVGGCSFTQEELLRALAELKQQKEQLPPMYSAIKINGKKLYDYARKNQEVERKSRPIRIYDLQLIDFRKNEKGHLEVDLRLSVSKGFYVRSFARDLGIRLGGSAIMKTLRRTKSDSFCVEEAISLKKVQTSSIKSVFQVFPTLEMVDVNDDMARLVENGIYLDERQIETDQPFYVRHKNDIIALYGVKSFHVYHPILIWKGRQ